MSRTHKYICGAIALVICPGAIPVALTAGALYVGGRAVRAIRRVRARRQIKRIVISHGQRADQWGQA